METHKLIELIQYQILIKEEEKQKIHYEKFKKEQEIIILTTVLEKIKRITPQKGGK